MLLAFLFISKQFYKQYDGLAVIYMVKDFGKLIEEARVNLQLLQKEITAATDTYINIVFAFF